MNDDPGLPRDMLDAVFLRATLREEFPVVLRQTRHEVSFFRGGICALATEQELARPFRDAYRRIVALLATVEQAIEAGSQKYEALANEFLRSGLLRCNDDELESSALLVETVKDRIRQINEAESRLIRVVSSAQRALLDHAEQGLIDWTNWYNCEFSILFDPGPARKFYETCLFDGTEPIRVRVLDLRDLSDAGGFNGPTDNWNVFEGRENHPLRGDRHGYLVHCLFDHLYMPWQLLARFKEIEVEFTFRDFETAWAKDAATPLVQPPVGVLDAVYLVSICQELGEVLYRAGYEMTNFRREFSALVTEQGLPAPYRAAIGRIVGVAAAVEQAINDSKKEHLVLIKELHAAGLCSWHESHLDSSSAVVETVKDTIRQINEAETRLFKVIESAKRALAEHAEKGVIDWSNSFSFEFAVLFAPGQARRFYETCAEGEEPLRVKVRFHDLVGSQNWNVFSGIEGHPLREGHHGYLVHCLFDHIHMPWQLFPHIQEIEVNVTFNDCGTMWAAQMAPPPITET